MPEPPLLPRGLRVLLASACFVVVIAGVKAAQGLVLQVLAAIFIAMIVAPLIFYLQRKGLPFVLALLLVLGAAVGFLIGAGTILTSSANQFARSLPSYQERMRETVGRATGLLEGLHIELPEDLALEQFIDPGQAMDLAAALFSGVGGVLTNSFVIFLIVIFILFEASTFPAKLREAFGESGDGSARFAQLTRSVNRYLAIKTAVSIVTGLLAALWCAVLGVDFAILWGMLAFLLNYVPNIGSLLAAVPPTLLAIVQFGFGKALVVAAGYLVLNNVLGAVIEPRFMGKGLGLSTLAVFLSLIFWGWVLGPVGMLLSIPLTMAVKIGLESDPETRWAAVLLSSGADIRKSEAEAEQAEG